MHKIIILKNTYNPRSHGFAEELRVFLSSLHKEVNILSGEAGLSLPNCDLVIVLGGDGSVLKAARNLVELKTPIFPINFGGLGYMANFCEESWQQPLLDVLEKKGARYYSPRMCLNVKVQRRGEILYTYRALNDCVISARGICKMVHLKAFYKGSDIGNYRVDGLILATPTGSTAYSLSAGGSVVDPTTRLILFTPICPHSLSQRPIIFSCEERVSLQVQDGQRAELALTIDGQEAQILQEGDCVHVQEDDQKVLLISSPSFNFYDLLASKMLQ